MKKKYVVLLTLFLLFTSLMIIHNSVSGNQPTGIHIISNWRYDITGFYVCQIGSGFECEWSANLLSGVVRGRGGSAFIRLSPGLYNIMMRVNRKENSILEHGINTTRGNRGLNLRSGQTFIWSMD